MKRKKTPLSQRPLYPLGLQRESRIWYRIMAGVRLLRSKALTPQGKKAVANLNKRLKVSYARRTGEIWREDKHHQPNGLGGLPRNSLRDTIKALQGNDERQRHSNLTRTPEKKIGAGVMPYNDRRCHYCRVTFDTVQEYLGHDCESEP